MPSESQAQSITRLSYRGLDDKGKIKIEFTLSVGLSSFNIQHKLSTASTWDNSNCLVTSSGVYRCTIANLTPIRGAAYDIRLRLVGLNFVPLTGWTTIRANIPAATPTPTATPSTFYVLVSNVTDTSFLIQPRNTSAIPTLQADVFVQILISPKVSGYPQFVLPSNFSDHTVSGLRPGTSYTVTIKAYQTQLKFTVKTTGNTPTPTPTATPTPSPLTYTISSITTNSALVTVTGRPSGTQRMVVLYDVASRPFLDKVINLTTETTVTITGLNPDTAYAITMTAFDSSRIIAKSLIVTFRTLAPTNTPTSTPLPGVTPTNTPIPTATPLPTITLAPTATPEFIPIKIIDLRAPLRSQPLISENIPLKATRTPGFRHSLNELPPGITVKNWVMGAQGRRVGAAGVGRQDVINQGIVDAIDMWGYITPGTELCFAAQGRLVFLDAAYAPRRMTSLQGYRRNGQTCTMLDRPGTVVLLESDEQLPEQAPAPKPTPAPSRSPSPPPLLGYCEVQAMEILNIRRQPPAGPVVGYLVPGIWLRATSKHHGYYKVAVDGVEGWISGGYASTRGDCRA